MLNSHSTLELLQHEYKESQLTLKPIELVSDAEVRAFIKKRENFWAALFWIAFIASILIAGMVGK